MPSLSATDPLPVLAALGQPVGDNLGGVQEVYLLPQAALLRSPVRSGSSIVGNLALRPGAVWYPLRAVLDTAGFDESFTQDRSQGLHVGRLQGELAEDTPELAEALRCYRNQRLVVLYRDRNDRLKLAGDATSWYQLSYQLDTQQGVTPRNGYKLELSGSTLQPALFYAGTFPLASGGTGTGAPPAGTGTVRILDRAGNLMGTARAGQDVTISSGFHVTLSIKP
ncbi:MAG: hypothetical protein ACRYFZ_03480 [Janthinobacterium lividum]